MGGERLGASGFRLLAGAFGQIEQIGLELGLRVLGFGAAWRKAIRRDQRLVAADFGGKRPIAGGLPRLAAQAVGLGGDLLQNIFEADKVLFGAL